MALFLALLACAGQTPDVPTSPTAPRPQPTPAPSPVPTPTPGPTTTPVAETAGVVAFTASFAVLALPDGTERRFHLHDQLTAFGTNLPFAADFDGDGLDAVGILDADGTVRFGSDNASGVLAEAWTVGPRLYPVPGDFDGDGVDGMGTHDILSGAVELWHGEPTGAPDLSLQIPPLWLAVAGDFDGDGVDGVAAVDLVTGTLRVFDDLAKAPRDVSFASMVAYPVAGDLDGDGVDTVGLYDWETQTLHWLDADGAPAASQTLGAATWFQWPVAGRWSTAGPLDEHEGAPWTLTTPVAAGFDEVLLDAGFDAAGQLGVTNALLVAHRGELVREAYWRGYDATMAGNMKSVSKSVLSALFGAASMDGLVEPEATVSSYLPAYFGADARSAITVSHLMTMSTGMYWDEAGVSFSAMLASPDWPTYVLSQPMVEVPGVFYRYSTGNTHVGSALLEEVTGLPTSEYARTALFEPLGIEATRWDEDPAGIDMGGAEVWMRPRDLLRFGQLYLDGGQADGTQILDPAWVDATFTPWVANFYGRWWRRWVLDGSEAWAAVGHGGQLVVVVPDRALVVVASSEWSVGYIEGDEQIDALYAILDANVVAAAP